MASNQYSSNRSRIMVRIFRTMQKHVVAPAIIMISCLIFNQLPSHAFVSTPTLPKFDPPMQSQPSESRDCSLVEALLIAQVAIVMTSSGQYSEALVLYEEILPILEKKGPTDFQALADVTGEMAVCYVNTEQLNNAEYYAIRSLQYADKCTTFSPSDFAIACNNAAYIKHHVGKNNEARELYKLAIGAVSSNNAIGKVSAALVRINLGDLELSLNQRKEALGHYRLALKDLLAETGVGYPAVIELKSKILKASAPYVLPKRKGAIKRRSVEGTL